MARRVRVFRIDGVWYVDDGEHTSVSPAFDQAVLEATAIARSEDRELELEVDWSLCTGLVARQDARLSR